MADVSREAKAIIAQIQNTTDLYLGTDNTKGEIKTRKLGIYTKSTYKRLLDQQVQQAIYVRENELQSYGGAAFSDTEIKNITKECASAVKESCKRYDTFMRENPTTQVNDVAAKRSKVIQYNNMTGSQWNNVKKETTKATEQAVTDHDGETLVHNVDKDTPNSVTVDNLTNEIEEATSKKTKVRTTSSNQLPALAARHEVNKMDKNATVGTVTVSESDTISYKHNEFIRNASLDVDRDGNGLVAQALAGGRIPSEDDFKTYMYALADKQAYNNLYSKKNDGTLYTPEEAQEVATKNRAFVDKEIMPAYLQLLKNAKDNNEVVVLLSSGNAFGKKLPNDEIMARIKDQLSQEADKAYNELKAAGKTLTPNNKSAMLQRLTDEARVLAQENDIDPSWVENLPAAELNKMINVNPVPVDPSVNTNGSVNNDGISSTSEGAAVTPSTDRYTPGNRTAINSERQKYNVSTNKPAANGRGSYTRRTHVASDYVKTYKTFSGHDMVVTVGIPIARGKEITKIIGAFQTITYSIHNEKMPIRCIGDMNAKRYVFGPRTVAGTLILTVFDRHWMKEMLDSYNTMIKAQGERYFLADELPAFNLTISAANEYGHNAKLALYGVTLVNEGQVMSINDVYTENTYQFYATNVEYLERVDLTTKSQKTSVKNIPIKGNTQQNTPSGDSKKAVPPKQIDTTPTFENFDPTSPSAILELIKDKEKLAAYIANMDKDANKKAQDALQEIIDKRKASQMTDEQAATAINKWENDEGHRRYSLFHDTVYDPIVQGAIRDFERGKTTEKQFAVVKDTLIQQDSYFTLWNNVSNKVAEEADSARDEVGTTVMRGSVEGLGLSLTKLPEVWKYITPSSTQKNDSEENNNNTNVNNPTTFTAKGISTTFYGGTTKISIIQADAYSKALQEAKRQLAAEGYDENKFTIISQNFDSLTYEYTLVVQPILTR